MIRKIMDSSIDTKQRIYYVVSMTSIIGNMSGFIANAALFGFHWPTLMCGFCALLMIVLFMSAYFTNTYQLPNKIMLFVLDIVEFPMLYYVYGKSVIVYMLLGIYATTLFCAKKRKWIISITLAIFDVFVILFSFLHPSTVEAITEANSIGSTVCSFIVVGFCIIVVTMQIIHQYELEAEKLHELSRELIKSANLDPLTKLYNRRCLTDYMEKLLNADKIDFYTVLLDIDNFKKINDTYGHLFGDEALIALSQFLLDAVSEKGIAARFGGEEFILILQNTDEAEIQIILETVKGQFAAFGKERGKGVSTFSGGVNHTTHIDKITEIFNMADTKMYQSKTSGKNKITY